MQGSWDIDSLVHNQWVEWPNIQINTSLTGNNGMGISFLCQRWVLEDSSSLHYTNHFAALNMEKVYFYKFVQVIKRIRTGS